MKIEERIKEVDLRPSDIVKLQVLTDAPIGLSQATGWIKNPTATKAIEQLLWRLCDEKVASGLTFSKPGRKKEGSAEIFSEEPITEPRADIYDAQAILRTIKEKNAQKIPTKKPINAISPTSPDHDATKFLAKRTHITLSPTGFPSWGADKTYKFVGTMLKVNFDGKAYNALNVTKLMDDFIIEGIPYLVSEFTKVG